MKAINWVVILGFVITIITQFLPDFPGEAATLAITNGVILVAYIVHKAKPAA